MAQAFAFDSLFVVLSQDSNVVYRIAIPQSVSQSTSAITSADVFVSEFYTLTTSEFSGLSGSESISTMCSMDYYGVFLGLDSGTIIATLKPTVTTQRDVDNKFQPDLDGDGLIQLGTSTSDDFVSRDVNSEHDGSAAGYRLLQTRGYMSRHRPCFVVTDNAVQRLVRITTVFNDYMDLSSTDMAGQSNFYSSDIPEAQMLRFHIMTIEPPIDSGTGQYDWDKASANVVDFSA